MIQVMMTRRTLLLLGAVLSSGSLVACGGRDAGPEQDVAVEAIDASDSTDSAQGGEDPADGAADARTAELLGYLSRKYPTYTFSESGGVVDLGEGAFSQRFRSDAAGHGSDAVTAAWSPDAGYRDDLYNAYHSDLLDAEIEALVAQGAAGAGYEVSPFIIRNDAALMPEEVGEDADPLEVLSRFEAGDGVTVYVGAGRDAFDRIVSAFEENRVAYDLTAYLFPDFPADQVFYSGNREGLDYEIVSAKKDRAEYGA